MTADSGSTGVEACMDHGPDETMSCSMYASREEAKDPWQGVIGHTIFSRGSATRIAGAQRLL